MTPDDPVHRIEIPLRFGDLDALGHVNQAVYHQLLEQARVALLGAAAGTSTGGFVLARVELDHRHELRLSDAVAVVEHRLERLGASSITLAFRVLTREGLLAAEGRSVTVAWDDRERRSRALSADERRRIDELLAA